MNLEDEIRTILDNCVNEIKRRSTAAGQVATGKTLRALEVRLRAEGTAVIGEIWGRPYTGALETGSRPARKRGTAGERSQMIRAMKEWCAVRGLTTGMTDKQAENFACWMAWYIKKYGTKLYRRGGRRDIITPALDATRDTLNTRLGEYAAQLFETNTDNKFFG